MLLIKQSTSIDVPVGPFLDETDGKTAETALTITQPDVRLKKNGGAWAQKNAAQTLSHEEAGWYEVTLDATDTNTLGHLVMAVHEAGALPVLREFLVVPANVYDALVGGSDNLQVHAVEISNDLITASAIAADAIGASELATDVIGAAEIAADAITAAELAADAVGASELATDAIGALELATDAIGAAELAANAIGASEVADDAVDAGAIALDAIGASEIAASAIGAAEVATDAIDADALAADAITAAEIAAGAIGASELAADAIGASELAADAVAELADAVWDEALAGHLTAGSTGAKLNSAGGAGGSGALSRTIGITVSGNPLEGASVWVTTDSAGTNVVAGTLVTSSMGTVTVLLDAGTYYVWMQKDGYNPILGTAITVS